MFVPISIVLLFLSHVAHSIMLMLHILHILRSISPPFPLYLCSCPSLTFGHSSMGRSCFTVYGGNFFFFFPLFISFVMSCRCCSWTDRCMYILRRYLKLGNFRPIMLFKSCVDHISTTLIDLVSKIQNNDQFLCFSFPYLLSYTIALYSRIVELPPNAPSSLQYFSDSYTLSSFTTDNITVCQLSTSD